MKKVFSALLVVLLIFSYGFAEPLVDEALLHLGEPYRYAAAGPHKFDCSGFTYYLVNLIYGIELKRTAYEQGYDDTYEKVETIEELQPGDLVYFNTNLWDNDLSDHAAIAISNEEIVHACSGEGGVVISSLTEGYYKERFSWGRRMEEVIK